MQKAIRIGEIFQVVPSRRFSLPCPSPLAAYQTLKKSNPSPYMFFMQDNDFHAVRGFSGKLTEIRRH
ncbi:Anthranilate synthase component 1 [Cedecea neteri]|uniref:anthranilate synthase n=1 Tax=Cedecea neteri TaxID=158822 RepID=A0A2X3J901_9ENTR|nr:Anthranilate synthase component 1 [Cedecea neteri]